MEVESLFNNTKKIKNRGALRIKLSLGQLDDSSMGYQDYKVHYKAKPEEKKRREDKRRDERGGQREKDERKPNNMKYQSKDELLERELR